MTFPARFPGRCNGCDERIHVDDPVRMTDDGVIHDDCAAIPTADPLAAPYAVCTTCWLTHPEGTCDR